LRPMSLSRHRKSVSFDFSAYQTPITSQKPHDLVTRQLFTKLCTSTKDSIKAQADTCAKKSSKNFHLSGLNKVLASPKNPSSLYLAWVRATRKKYLTNPRKSRRPACLVPLTTGHTPTCLAFSGVSVTSHTPSLEVRPRLSPHPGHDDWNPGQRGFQFTC